MREIVARLREKGWSFPRIADKLHIGTMTAYRDANETPLPNGKPATVTGADGKEYPANYNIINERGMVNGSPEVFR